MKMNKELWHTFQKTKHLRLWMTGLYISTYLTGLIMANNFVLGVIAFSVPLFTLYKIEKIINVLEGENNGLR